MYTIYRLISPSEKSYIGWTSEQLNKRLYKHNYEANHRAKTKFHKALKKYSLEKWEKFILFETKDFELSQVMEKSFIDIFDTINNGYNIAIGGQRGMFGYKHSSKSKNKMAKAHRISWQITHPNGYTEKIKDLVKFCLIYNLDKATLRKTACEYENRTHHKGFKAIKLV